MMSTSTKRRAGVMQSEHSGLVDVSPQRHLIRWWAERGFQPAYAFNRGVVLERQLEDGCFVQVSACGNRPGMPRTLQDAATINWFDAFGRVLERCHGQDSAEVYGYVVPSREGR